MPKAGAFVAGCLPDTLPAAAQNCDTFLLDVADSPTKLTVKVGGTDGTDVDVDITGPGGEAFSGSAVGPETVVIESPADGRWTIRTKPFVAQPTGVYAGSAVAQYGSGSGGGGTGGGTGGGGTPAAATFADRSYVGQAAGGLDPILFTDDATGRTSVSHLLLACSNYAFSDDAGASWVGPTGGCAPGAVDDHQTIGGGAYVHYDAGDGAAADDPSAALYGRQPTDTFPSTFFYCAHADVTASCGRSTDGGVTFGPAVPLWTVADCGGLHGHLKVSPKDGTVYVPNADCGGLTALATSRDGGLTYDLRHIPGSTTPVHGFWDPSVGIDDAGTLFVSYTRQATSTTQESLVSVSHDHGLTWTDTYDVGAAFGVQNVAFPEAVAGSDGRAAVAFLGTSTPGDSTAADFQKDGTAWKPDEGWRLYVAVTLDDGKHWNTTDVTGAAPVQRGCIFDGGGSNPCRNLLDFNDMTVDDQGRVLIAWADGCVSACETSAAAADHTFAAQLRVTRLDCGVGLRALPGETSADPFAAGQPLCRTGSVDPFLPEAPWTPVLPVAAAAVLAGGVLMRRRRRPAV